MEAVRDAVLFFFSWLLLGDDLLPEKWTVDHSIQGTSPPVDGAFSPTGHLASFDLETIPATPMVKGTTHVTTLESLTEKIGRYLIFVEIFSLTLYCSLHFCL